jgi:hypothetical protein
MVIDGLDPAPRPGAGGAVFCAMEAQVAKNVTVTDDMNLSSLPCDITGLLYLIQSP